MVIVWLDKTKVLAINSIVLYLRICSVYNFVYFINSNFSERESIYLWLWNGWNCCFGDSIINRNSNYCVNSENSLKIIYNL